MPASTKAARKASNVPKSCMEARTILVNPAAGPDTLMGDPLKAPVIIPPKAPAMSPEIRGAPEAREMPRQSGTATKKTTSDAGKSCDRLLEIVS